MNKLTIFNVRWEINTAGPSPDNNNRVEIFMKGCNKAIDDPCKGCFNQELWDSSTDTYHDPKEVAKQINEHAPNKYVSISGGEPFDQLPALIELTKELKKYGFHILVYTHYELKDLVNRSDDTKKLLKNIDILIDGPYIEELNIYDLDKEDGLHNSVGSSNQVIWDVHDYNHSESISVEGFKAGDLDALFLKEGGSLLYIVKDMDLLNEIVTIVRG